VRALFDQALASLKNKKVPVEKKQTGSPRVTNSNLSKENICRKLGKFVDHFDPGRFLLWKILVGTTIYTAFICWIDVHGFPAKKTIEANAAMSISAVLGLLLIFRNNSAYERWWEGRKLWGQLVNESRNLALKTRSYAEDLDPAQRAEFATLIAGFALSLKDQLRGLRDPELLAQMSIPVDIEHPPSAIALEIYKRLKRWRKEGIIDQWEQLQLDQHAKTLMDICGGAERILKSPIAGSYKVLLWLGLILNSVCLPWLLVPLFHWWSIAIMVVSSYFIFALELLAEEVERPFDDLPNDLPLGAICETIMSFAAQSCPLNRTKVAP
jgi:putative membrane protein